MKPVGRNDPCPCGSGKKYKRCCLDRAGSVGAYTGAEREAALDGLFRFAARAGGAVLSARAIVDAGGEPVGGGSPSLSPPEAQDELLKLLRRAYRAFCREFPRESLTAFFKRMPILYHRFWLDTVALVPDPRLVTAEGDDIVLARVVFDVRDRGVVEAVLARHTDFARQDDGSYVWLEAEEAGRKRPSRRAANAIQLTSMRLGGGTEPRRSLGTVVPEGNRLVFEAISKRRAERGRAMIEALAGGAAAPRATR